MNGTVWCSIEPGRRTVYFCRCCTSSLWSAAASTGSATASAYRGPFRWRPWRHRRRRRRRSRSRSNLVGCSISHMTRMRNQFCATPYIPPLALCNSDTERLDTCQQVVVPNLLTLSGPAAVVPDPNADPTSSPQPPQQAQSHPPSPQQPSHVAPHPNLHPQPVQPVREPLLEEHFMTRAFKKYTAPQVGRPLRRCNVLAQERRALHRGRISAQVLRVRCTRQQREMPPLLSCRWSPGKLTHRC